MEQVYQSEYVMLCKLEKACVLEYKIEIHKENMVVLHIKRAHACHYNVSVQKQNDQKRLNKQS